MENIKVLIATPLYPPQVGGPSKYAKNLKETFEGMGLDVEVVAYSKIEQKLPIGIRHLYYLFRLILAVRNVQYIIALDAMSVGLPAVVLSILTRKPICIRVGGDFLWETYVERTQEKVFLSDFYNKPINLSIKEKIIFLITRWVLSSASAVAFTTTWQLNIFKKAYKISNNFFVVENHFEFKSINHGYNPLDQQKKIFISSSRKIFLKNQNLLESVFNEVKKNRQDIELYNRQDSFKEFQDKILNAYAVIVPSISEVSSNLILESISNGIPFIVTSDIGIKDRIKDIAIFINPFDPIDIKDKIFYLLDEENYKKQKRAILNWDFVHPWSEIANEFLNIKDFINKHGK